jgi:hypothetical protein
MPTIVWATWSKYRSMEWSNGSRQIHRRKVLTSPSGMYPTNRKNGILPAGRDGTRRTCIPRHETLPIRHRRCCRRKCPRMKLLVSWRHPPATSPDSVHYIHCVLEARNTFPWRTIHLRLIIRIDKERPWSSFRRTQSQDRCSNRQMNHQATRKIPHWTDGSHTSPHCREYMCARILRNDTFYSTNRPARQLLLGFF